MALATRLWVALKAHTYKSNALSESDLDSDDHHDATVALAPT